MLIQPISCKGFSISLAEITIGQALDIAKLPIKKQESNLTQLLTYACKSVSGAISDNPRLWTIGQRYLAMGQYLASVFEDGIDFSTGTYTYADYLQDTLQHDHCTINNDAVLYVENIGDDNYGFTQLLGWQVEAIETIAENYTDWVFAAMAACLRVNSEIDSPIHTHETSLHDYCEFLIARTNAFKNYPESVFIELQYYFLACLGETAHFFKVWFDNTGVVVIHSKEGILGTGLESARFLVHDAINRATIQLCGQPSEHGG